MEEEGEVEECKFRILMFPWLAHGHIFPFIELSKHLSRRSCFHVYFCSTAINLVSIRKHIRNEYPTIQLVELPMAASPELPPQFHTTKALPPRLWPNLLKAFQESSCSFQDILDSLKPDFLIYDFFQPWAPKIALSRGIDSAFFAASGAASYAFYYHMYMEGTSSTFPYPAIHLQDYEMIDFGFRKSIKDAEDNEFLFGNFALSRDVILMKSCRAVERKYIDYLSDICKKRVVITGPLIADANEAYPYDDEEMLAKIMEWLSGKSKRSTVYVSFGSEYFLSGDELGEIAKGLELCDANFLWVVRFPSEEKTGRIEEAMPKGFLDRVVERGMIVRGWAPQTKILAHRSIGSFMSHCGWSSVMESMYFGVPIIAMPMKSEQPANARLATEVGVGVEVGKSRDGRYTGEEMAKTISMVMAETPFCEDLRNRAIRVSKEMRENAEGEASRVAEELQTLCTNKKKKTTTTTTTTRRNHEYK
ncbi:beta-D-glucosyl crocetin beta-1,6-glucosyltransferase-like [Andrographis paniculata]|uniref:beta-D-glucosyl crocetin beta-1,6-glucosyltransferase-like n=1 Tax=Andrographis paniculata TaxID=175694 RepID=UPI0021E7B4D5|nr:beta-D-glucosyl crocetin beta-1,6-glucosyltransferase-like [Andrographis paniculata]